MHNHPYEANTFDFFNLVIKNVQNDNRVFIVVSHILPDTGFFLNTLSKIGKIIAIVPKPKSICKESIAYITNAYNEVSFLDKNKTSDAEYMSNFISTNVSDSDNLFIIDIGGYFSNSIIEISNKVNVKNIRVIEDTENGYQKYDTVLTNSKNTLNKNTSIYSVARSLLKETEDYLVGKSIIFSTERILKNFNHGFNNRTIGVIGLGKIGKSISLNLRQRNKAVFVTILAQ